MKKRIALAAAFGAAAFCLTWLAAQRASASSTDLTTWTFTAVDVPLQGVTRTYVRDMNPAGQIVGDYTQTGVGTRGFLLSGGVFTTIAVRAGGHTTARGINPEGDIVGSVWGGGLPARSFVLSKGVVTEFGFPGASNTIAEDIDAPGDIVGYYLLAGVNHGFVYRNGVFTTIDFPGAIWTTVRGINPEGEMVGVYRFRDPDRERNHGFLLDIHGQFITVNGPDSPGGNASGINPRGDIVGEYYPGALIVGFLLSGGRSIPFSFPGATITRPFKITPDGQYIVGFYNDAHGFVLSRRP